MSTFATTLFYTVYDSLFPPSDPGRSWRDLAASEARLRSELFEAGQVAWHQGQKSESKRVEYLYDFALALSSLAKEHGKKMEHYNSLAEQAIFAHFNPSYPHPITSPSFFSLLSSLFRSTDLSDLKQIDLHGLFVNEAIARSQTHLTLSRKSNLKRTTFITGRGSHSADGTPKIKIAVLGMLQREGVRVEESKNEGVVVAVLDEGRVVITPFSDAESDAEDDWVVVTPTPVNTPPRARTNPTKRPRSGHRKTISFAPDS
ncbi:hypothetical protein FRB99_004862 [Tulasnella sp. 403]|nr:hypothetical protein FRB99_004862 [Tulasnella sp. 403]